MRYILFAISIIFLILTLLYKFNRKNEANAGKEGEMITTVDLRQKIIDVGDRTKNSSIIGRFTLVNKGMANLYIKSVVPNCHCTVGKFSKDAIKPNDSAVIVMRYDSTILGIFQSSAVVTLNAEQSPLLLVLQGNIVDSLLYYKKNRLNVSKTP